MNPSAAQVQQAAVLVRRSRAGDENAMALLAKIGEVARAGKNPTAKAAMVAVQKYIAAHPAQPLAIGAEPAALMDPPEQQEIAGRPQGDPELRKPPLPRGIFSKMLRSPEDFAATALRARQYRHGLPAAAVVLASGPALTQSVVAEMGASGFASDEAMNLFFHGVKFPSDDVWKKIGRSLDPALCRALYLGQCVGRARKIQAVRMKDSPISSYSEVAGWELGE